MTFRVTVTLYVLLTDRVCRRTFCLTPKDVMFAQRMSSFCVLWAMWTASRSTSTPSVSLGRRSSDRLNGKGARLLGETIH